MSASNVAHLALPPLRHSAADDAYTAWFNAEQRCSAALRAWREASSKDRAAAYRAYVSESGLEDSAAAELERLCGQRLAVHCDP